MPIHVDKLPNDEPLPVKPETNEYDALSFLVAHHEYGFTPSEIADRTDISKSSTSKTMARLFEKGLVERSKNVYYIEPVRADKLKQRLKSLDSAVQLFESTPNDDIYAEERWEKKLPSIDPDEGTDTTSEEGPATAEARAEDLIADIEDCRAEE